MNDLGRFGVIRIYENGDEAGHKVVVVDVQKAKYQGRPWASLNRFFRRKFENLVVLSEPTARIRCFYQLPNGLFYDRESAADAHRLRHGITI